MHQKLNERVVDLDPQETAEWMASLDQVLDEAGPDRAAFLLEQLTSRARLNGADLPNLLNTPYINTIPPEEEVSYPGDRAMERRIKSLIRWNAMAMVVRQNKYDAGIGGHISTYASLATLLEVGFNHFFHASYGDQPGDLVYFQGHASPGVYARAFLEGRLTEDHLKNFRHELREHPGLSSYPHPWLMPDFWSFPTVSMGIAPINAIYQARFMRYMENRGLIAKTPRHVWAFLGDGESDEPESMGSITLAAREKLDNLIFVINCNLQRLDGPVRGNGKIIQELEAAFRGAGWNVIKTIWGSDWEPLLARDTTGLLQKRMGEVVDGEYQTYITKDGAYIRKNFFGKYPELLDLVSHLSDEELMHLRRGGHDPRKVYNAYKAAVDLPGFDGDARPAAPRGDRSRARLPKGGHTYGDGHRRLRADGRVLCPTRGHAANTRPHHPDRIGPGPDERPGAEECIGPGGHLCSHGPGEQTAPGGGAARER